MVQNMAPGLNRRDSMILFRKIFEKIKMAFCPKNIIMPNLLMRKILNLKIKFH